jgi:hypothetical protein
MGRGAALLDEQKTFSGQLKRAFRFLNNPQFDPWEVGNALFGRLTQGLKRVLIAVDWTQVGDFMILEATLVVAGRGIPFLYPFTGVEKAACKTKPDLVVLDQWTLNY